MEVRSVRSLATSQAAVLVLGMYAGPIPAPGTRAALRQLGDWVEGALSASRFEGKPGQAVVLPSTGTIPPARVVVVGLGDEVDHEGLRQAAAVATRAADELRIATTLHQVPIDGAVQAICEGIGLARYRFDAYRSSPAAREDLVVELVSPPRGFRAEAEAATIVTRAVTLARDLVNEPSAGKGPMELAERVSGSAEAVGLEAEVWDVDRLADERMGGLLGVGGGSHRPPCLLRLRRRVADGPRLALVGKGIVFDSGGLSLKTAEGMQTMKTDMAGAAAVAAAAMAVAELGLPVDLDVLAPLAENMPGGRAQRPGDVLRIRNGRTIEVLNTDAEGRLVLADALALAAEEEPDLIVDLATLTGAAKVALGEEIAGLFGNREESVEAVSEAARRAGERVWPLPLPPDYRELIDSEVADMKNTGGRFGGAIAGALLLAEFVGDIPWAHVDIAGPARSEKVKHYIPKGGTGFGVRTLIELAAGM